MTPEDSHHTNAFAVCGVNPFEDDVIIDPRDVDFSVPGLNDRPLGKLVEAFEIFEKGALPRRPIGKVKARLLTSPDRGFGKSHLIGRLFKKLESRASQIYVRPYQDPKRCWQSILLATIQNLQRADFEQSDFLQLEAFSLGVLAHVVSADFEIRHPEDKESQERVVALRSDPLRIFRNPIAREAWIDWIKSRIENPDCLLRLEGLLSGLGIDLNGREQAWLKVIAGYALCGRQSLGRRAALKWLRAESLEVDELRLLKLSDTDNYNSPDSSAEEINELCFRRLQGLCALASFYRPFLFCLDQTEFYGTDPELAKSLGSCLERLFADFTNVLTIVPANTLNWTVDILRSLDPAHQDKIAPPISLEGIDQIKGKELITKRLMEFKFLPEEVASFMEGAWYANLFEINSEVGIRLLLQKAAARFRALANATVLAISLDDLFSNQVNELRAKPHLQVYHQDSLMWFTQELVIGYSGVEVVKKPDRYFSNRWVWPKSLICFCYEVGDNHRRWKSIADGADQIMSTAAVQTSHCYVLRTPELTGIVPPGWAATNPGRLAVQRAVTSGSLIIKVLIPEEICQIYAARELYSNAVQGNIDYSPPKTLAWLKERFEPFFKALVYPVTPPPPPPKPELTEEQLSTVLNLVSRLLLVDVAWVLQELKDNDLLDSLLVSVEKHPNMKAHKCPQTIYLQWRSFQ